MFFTLTQANDFPPIQALPVIVHSVMSEARAHLTCCGCNCVHEGPTSLYPFTVHTYSQLPYISTSLTHHHTSTPRIPLMYPCISWLPSEYSLCAMSFLVRRTCFVKLYLLNQTPLCYQLDSNGIFFSLPVAVFRLSTLLASHRRKFHYRHFVKPDVRYCIPEPHSGLDLLL